MSDRKSWSLFSFEDRADRFYGVGVENYGDYHGGFLNFGLWLNGNVDYLVAAKSLISHVGDSIGLSKKSNLLDIACGLAAQDVFMRERYGCEIDCLDVCWKHVVLGRQRVSSAKCGEFVRVHHGSAIDLPFTDASFSHVMGIEGPAHFDTREDFFKEAFRVLKPNGVMGLSDYVLKSSPHNFVSRLLLIVACWLWHAPKANRDTIFEYERKLVRCGFVNVSIVPVGKWVIPGYYRENLKRDNIDSLVRIRGFWVAHFGRIIDFVMYKVFRKGVIEYVLVRAQKPL